MKVQVTLDYWDGTRSKARDVDMEQISGRDLMFMMMEEGVAGITITKKLPVTKMVDRMRTPKHTESGEKIYE